MKPYDYDNNCLAVISNLDPALMEQLLELKSLIKGDSSLDDFVEFFDDIMLLSFIKGKKFNTQKAFITLVNYIQIKRKYPNIFKTLLPSTTASLNAGLLRILKSRDEHNRAIMINRSWKWDPKVIPGDDTHKMMMLLMDYFLQHAFVLGIEGMVAVFDMKNMTFDQFKAATPATLYQMIDLLWKNVPVRYSALHIVNGGFFLTTILKIVHPFLPKKARQRLLVHSSNESLHDHISREILPESLGGFLPEEDAFHQETEEQIRNKEEYYQKFADKL